MPVKRLQRRAQIVFLFLSPAIFNSLSTWNTTVTEISACKPNKTLFRLQGSSWYQLRIFASKRMMMGNACTCHYAFGKITLSEILVLKLFNRSVLGIFRTAFLPYIFQRNTPWDNLTKSNLIPATVRVFFFNYRFPHYCLPFFIVQKRQYAKCTVLIYIL